MGHFDRTGRGTVVVRGQLGGRRVSYRVPVSIRARVGDHQALPRLVARRRIRALLIDQLRADDPDLVERITRLGLRYGLVTPYTAFVAVDRRPAVDGRPPRVYVVPVDLPAGLAGQTEVPGGVLGGQAGGAAGTATGVGETRHVETAAPASAADADADSGAGGMQAESVAVSGSAAAPAPARWRFAVGLGLGGAVAGGDRGGHPLVGSLHLGAVRGVTPRFTLGVRLGLASGGLDRAPDLASLLFEASGWVLRGRAVELVGGIGAALASGSDPGLALSAALRLGRGNPRIELRYLHALVPGAPDAGAATLGLELRF